MTELPSINDIRSHGIQVGVTLTPDLQAGKTIPANVALSERIWQEFEPGYRGHAIDVGASDGESCNSTWYLEVARLWTCLCVEANPDFASLLKRTRIWTEIVACGAESIEEADFWINRTTNPEEGSSLAPQLKRSAKTNDLLSYKAHKTRVVTVDQLLTKWQFPKLDLLCIDTEGTELDVLKGCDLTKWKPKVIVTECWFDQSPIDPYLAEFGYEKVDRQVDNDVYRRA